MSEDRPRDAAPPGALEIVADGEEPFYIVASSPLADEQRRVLNQGETFAVFDHYGDIKPGGLGEEGLYHLGTRHLSSLVLRLNADRPMLLSSTVKEDSALLVVDLTNPDIQAEGRVVVHRGTLHVMRSKFLWDGACHERLELHNYSAEPLRVALALYFEADFADIFEVRGLKRARRGRRLESERRPDGVTLAYEGLDGVVRRTRIGFDPPPALVTGGTARREFQLGPRGSATWDVITTCEVGGDRPRPADYASSLAQSERRQRRLRAEACEVHTSNELFNNWIRRAVTDLTMMTAEKAEGPYPYAGVPWFSTPFGRDGIITALECLWINPGMARGVLAYLAATQAVESSPAQDAEPGKILHETRQGELAALGEIPFGRYYGSVDATPLFVSLAAAYLERTGDRAFVERLWPHVELALEWIGTYGDVDGDGFVEYARRSQAGLLQQGWKDSEDSVFHDDGRIAEPPIALCEVQGYVYQALGGAAAMASALGQLERAAQLSHEAWTLRERFEQAFWLEDLGTYALALDGAKRPCHVRTSNPGHCLYSRIAAPGRAARVARSLLDSAGFSGWGVRTVAATEARYNPMSYHNGSVWPHDNALVAQGLAHYRLKDEAIEILAGMFGASLFFDLHRMPELFCGFDRRPDDGPTLYPVACAPQAWAAGAVFMLLQACLGLEVRGDEPQVAFRYPRLPPFLEEVRIRRLAVAGASVDLLVRRHHDDVAVNVLERRGEVGIVVLK